MTKVIERILNLLAFLLTVDRPVTADEIRNTVAGYGQENDEAFRRMFERDKDLLRQLGIPITLQTTDTWEVEFGYVVPPEEYELKDPGLTDEERTALWLAAQVVRLGGTTSEPGAILKLGGGPLAAAGEPLAVDLGDLGEELGVAFEAVRERRRLSFVYRDKERRLEPYGLVHRRGHWYTVGRDLDADEVRIFRLDRTEGLKAGDADAFTRPRGFSAGAALSDLPWEAGQEDVTAHVVFDAEVAWWAERQLGPRAKTRRTKGGALDVTMPVANSGAFVGWLLAFEDHAEVLEPQELRGALVARVDAAA